VDDPSFGRGHTNDLRADDADIVHETLLAGILSDIRQQFVE
jgi:hypothetical protein